MQKRCYCHPNVHINTSTCYDNHMIERIMNTFNMETFSSQTQIPLDLPFAKIWQFRQSHTETQFSVGGS